MPHLVSPAAHLVGDQVRGHDLAQVAQVDGAGGESPEATTTPGLPGARRSDSAMTSSAKRETQSVVSVL